MPVNLHEKGTEPERKGRQGEQNAEDWREVGPKPAKRNKKEGKRGAISELPFPSLGFEGFKQRIQAPHHLGVLHLLSVSSPGSPPETGRVLGQAQYAPFHSPWT